MEDFSIILFYAYTHVADPKATLDWQQTLCQELNLRGRVRIAAEGINATLAGTRANIQLYIDRMNSLEVSSFVAKRRDCFHVVWLSLAGSSCLPIIPICVAM